MGQEGSHCVGLGAGSGCRGGGVVRCAGPQCCLSPSHPHWCRSLAIGAASFNSISSLVGVMGLDFTVVCSELKACKHKKMRGVNFI